MTDPTVTAAYHQDAITTVTLCSPDPLIEHPGVTVEVTWTLGRHDDALRADPDALTVGRYYDRHPCAAAPINGHVCPLPPRYVTLAGVAEATAGAVMVGNNVSYDLTVLGRHLDRPAAAWHYQPIDIKPLAAGWLAARGVSWEGVYPSTSQIADILGVPRPEDTRHTALGDARWVRDVYDTIMVA